MKVTKRRNSNAINSRTKGKKSTGAASISASSDGNRPSANANESNANSNCGESTLLASQGSPKLLETAQSDSGVSRNVVSNSGVELKSAEHHVFEESGLKLSHSFEENYNSNFGKTHKAEANGQLNLLECEEDNNEPPEPDDYANLEDFKKDWDAWALAQFDECKEKLSPITAEEIWANNEKQSSEQLNTGNQELKGSTSKTRTALELAQDCKLESPAEIKSTASDVQPSEIVSIGESRQSLLAELNICNLGSMGKAELLSVAIASHEQIAIIERQEFELGLMKLQQAKLIGLCLQEFKRRCRHGEFESSLTSANIRPRTAQDYMSIANNWHLIESKARSFADLDECQALSINWALGTVREEKKALRSAAPSSDPDNWRTPDTKEQPILFLIKQTLGIITLDPAADDAKSVPALKHFTKADDGLAQEWEGYVYLFPPPSNPLPWIKKLCFFRARGDVKGAISLLKSDCLNNNQEIGELVNKYASAVCNWRDKIHFLNEDGELVKGVEFEWTFVYFGREPHKFEKNFSRWGTVSLLDQKVANDQLPLTTNNQQLATVNSQQSPTFSSAKQEETAAAKDLGLSNGTTILPDVRDSDRAMNEACDPHYVATILSSETKPTPIEINHDTLNEYMIAVTSNASKFTNHQSGHIIKSLLNVNFPNRVKGMLARLSEQKIKSLILLCDEELDERAKK